MLTAKVFAEAAQSRVQQYIRSSTVVVSVSGGRLTEGVEAVS